MLDDFLTRFSLTARSETAAGSSLPGVPTGVDAITGCTFEARLYRVHHAASAVTANQAVLAAFPTFAGRIACFGFDWLGRQFSIDPTRGPKHDPGVLMFEPGTGQALEIPTRFSSFHDAELVEFSDAALAAGFLGEWIQTPTAIQPLPFDACVGYRVPLSSAATTPSETLNSSASMATGQSRANCEQVPNPFHRAGRSSPYRSPDPRGPNAAIR